MTQPAFIARHLPGGLLILTLLALLTGCGQAPDDQALSQALNQELQRAHLDQLFTVDHIDNAERYRHDDSLYSVAVRYTLRAKRDLSSYDSAVKNDTSRDALDRFAMIMTLAAVKKQFGDFSKGDTFKQERRIRLEHSDDKGWFIPPPDRPAPPGE